MAMAIRLRPDPARVTTPVARNARRLEDWLLLAGIVVNLTVALTAGHFPYHDASNHLARYVLIERVWSSSAVPWVSVHLVPTPYIALDLIGVALVHWLGPDAALHVLALLPLIALPVGMYLLLLATAPSQRAWALVGVLLSFSWWYVAGSLNFTLGLGLLCAALAIWWRRRDGATSRSLVLLGLAGAALLAVHLFAALMFLVVIWVDLGLRLIARREVRLARPATRLLTAGAATAGVAVVWVWMEVATAGQPVRPPDFEWRLPLSQLKNLASPFLVFSVPQLVVVSGGYLLAVIGLLAHRRKRGWLEPFTVSAAVFLVLYVVSPRTWNIDLRWLPPAYLLPFCGPSTRPRPHWRLISVLFAFCVAHALTVAGYARLIRRELQEFDVALAQLPAGSRVLPLVSDHRRFRVRPYYHYALWHTIRTSGQVGGLFSRDGTREDDGTYTHLSHFKLRHVPYFPVYDWGTTLFQPLDCRKVERDYDYVLQAGRDSEARALIVRCAAPAFEAGEITVYRVPESSGRTAR